MDHHETYLELFQCSPNVPAYIWHLSTHNAGIINENNTILSMQTIWALVY